MSGAMTVAMTVWAGMHGLADIFLMGLDLPPDAEEAIVGEVTDRILAGYGATE